MSLSGGAASTTRLGVLQRHDWQGWRQLARQGDTNGRLPYNVQQLERHGYELVHGQAQFGDGPVVGRLAALTDRVGRVLDQEITHPVFALPALREVDAVLAIFEDMAWPWRSRAAAARLPPLVVVSCWLGQRLLLPDPAARRRWRAWAQQVRLLTVFSHNQVPLVRGALGLPADRVLPLTFGVDTEFFTPADSRTGGHVLAAGGDVGRDWDTFLHAAALTPQVSYKWMTTHDQSGARGLSNVEVVQPAFGRAYRQLLQQADLVLVPTRPVAYPTGQSVLLEALACGTPVVATRTPALREYLTIEATVGVEPEDAQALASTVERAMNDASWLAAMRGLARGEAVRRYSDIDMWNALAEVTRAAGL